MALIESYMKAFEVTKEDIERLDEYSFTNVMQKLLRAEMSKLRLKQSDLTVSLDIHDPDGGLDGYIGCEISEDHPWLPSGRSGWQFKAVRNFSTSQAEAEVLKGDKTDIKPRIKKLLEQGESYVLVIGGKDYNPDQLEERENKISVVFKTKGFTESTVKVYSSGQIAEWVNSNPSVVVHLRLNRANFKDISEWKNTSIVIKEPSKFFADEKRTEIIKSIRNLITSNHNGDRATIIRLVGLTGVGKTRLIYETLNTEELRELVLYTESPYKLPTSRFNEIAGNEDISAIFVIDECAHDKYVELAKEVEGIGGRITLITLDLDKDQVRDYHDKHLFLEPLEDDALDALIQLTVPGLTEMARRKISNFSEGYPKIAVRLAEHFSSHPELLSPVTLSELRLDDLFNRMIAGRSTQISVENVKKVLTTISLFKRLGWDDEVSYQGRTACENLGINWNEAKILVKGQEERGLVIKRGRYRYISPLPLAIYLASSWWKAMDDSTWLDFHDNLPDFETKKAFLDRLPDLSQSEYAKEIIKKKNAEFDYDQLNSELGSEIFLNLSKADHLLAIETLERILGSLPREKLLEFEAGRRNVVWTLEKIAWWPDTFHSAARLLLKLADAENEAWSNNATGVFTQLFQTVLGGTTVPAWERHGILEEALNSGEKTIQKLALDGLKEVFNLMHASRTVSGEEQGTVIPPPEWNPKTREDLTKSVLSALNILYRAIKMPDSEIQAEAAKIFLSNVRILLAYQFENEVMNGLRQIQIRFPHLEKDIIEVVEGVIFYDSKKLPEEVINKVITFRDELIATDFKGLMNRYVKSRLLEDVLEENKDKVDAIVRELVVESINFPEKLKKELDWLVTSEAENGHIFGYFLGELDTDFYWLDRILQALKESGNPSVYFLGGYLFSIKSRNEDLWEETLERCYTDETLREFSLEIIWRSGANDKVVDIIIRLLTERVVRPPEIKMLIYGAWFRDISGNKFLEFIEEYYKIEDGKYATNLLGIIDQYVETHSNFISNAKDIVLNYLTIHEIFEDSDTLYHWDKLSLKFMEEFNEAISCFLDLVLGILMKKNYVELEPYIREKFKYFLEKDFENTWDTLKMALLAYDRCAWSLSNILKGDYAHSRREKNSLLGFIPEKDLWKWVEESPSEAPYILAGMIPLHESEPDLNPLARQLLIKCPTDEDITSALSANWHTEGWAGLRSEHYKNKLEIAEEWIEDSEPAVSSWARKEVEYLKRGIELAKREEEERGV